MDQTLKADARKELQHQLRGKDDLSKIPLLRAELLRKRAALDEQIHKALNKRMEQISFADKLEEASNEWKRLSSRFANSGHEIATPSTQATPAFSAANSTTLAPGSMPSGFISMSASTGLEDGLTTGSMYGYGAPGSSSQIVSTDLSLDMGLHTVPSPAFHHVLTPHALSKVDAASVALQNEKVKKLSNALVNTKNLIQLIELYHSAHGRIPRILRLLSVLDEACKGIDNSASSVLGPDLSAPRPLPSELSAPVELLYQELEELCALVRLHKMAHFHGKVDPKVSAMITRMFKFVNDAHETTTVWVSFVFNQLLQVSRNHPKAMVCAVWCAIILHREQDWWSRYVSNYTISEPSEKSSGTERVHWQAAQAALDQIKADTRNSWGLQDLVEGFVDSRFRRIFEQMRKVESRSSQSRQQSLQMNAASVAAGQQQPGGNIPTVNSSRSSSTPVATTAAGGTSNSAAPMSEEESQKLLDNMLSFCTEIMEEMGSLERKVTPCFPPDFLVERILMTKYVERMALLLSTFIQTAGFLSPAAAVRLIRFFAVHGESLQVSKQNFLDHLSDQDRKFLAQQYEKHMGAMLRERVKNLVTRDSQTDKDGKYKALTRDFIEEPQQTDENTAANAGGAMGANKAHTSIEVAAILAITSPKANAGSASAPQTKKTYGPLKTNMPEELFSVVERTLSEAACVSHGYALAEMVVSASAALRDYQEMICGRLRKQNEETLAQIRGTNLLTKDGSFRKQYPTNKSAAFDLPGVSDFQPRAMRSFLPNKDESTDTNEYMELRESIDERPARVSSDQRPSRRSSGALSIEALPANMQYVCAQANNASRCLQFSEELKESLFDLLEEAFHEKLDSLQPVVDGFYTMESLAMRLLCDIIHEDLDHLLDRLFSAGSGTEVIMDVVQVLQDSFQELQADLLGHHFKEIVIQALKRVVQVYISKFTSKCAEPFKVPVMVVQIEKDCENLEQFFSRFVLSAVLEINLSPLTRIRSLLVCIPTVSELRMAYEQLIYAYPAFTPENARNVLQSRGIGKELINAALRSIQELEPRRLKMFEEYRLQQGNRRVLLKQASLTLRSKREVEHRTLEAAAETAAAWEEQASKAPKTSTASDSVALRVVSMTSPPPMTPASAGPLGAEDPNEALRWHVKSPLSPLSQPSLAARKKW